MDRLASFVVFAWSVALIGCDGSPPPPPRPDPDEARECYPPGMDAGTDDGGVAGCRPGELCLEGRCYASCREDADCGPREMCAPSGACIRATSDAGVRDAGPPDPCDAVECTAPLVCHPLSGTCVECNEDTISAPMGEPGHCSPEVAPICDIANGRCVATAPAQCAPCLSDAGCTTSDGFMGRCISREVMGIHERVCMSACTAEGTCPAGLTCDADTMLCVPPIGLPCTNWLAGTRSQGCLSDVECGPLGAPSTAVYRDVCEGEVIATGDGGASTPGGCLLPCGTDPDCGSGQVCMAGFCRAAPPVKP